MKRIHLLFIAALSWPLSYTYYQLPGWCDFPYFVTLALFAIIYFYHDPKREYAVNRVKLCGDVTTDDLKSRAELAGIKAPTPQSWSRVLVKPMFQRISEVKSSGGHHKIGVYRLAGEV